MLDFPVVEEEPPDGTSGPARRPRRSGASGWRSHRWRRTSTPPVDRLAVGAAVAVAAVSAATASGAPTVVAPVNTLLRTALAVGVTLAATSARRWTWVILAGVTAAAASVSSLDGVLATTAAGNALVIAVVAAAADIRYRWLGAVVGALATTALLRLGPAGPLGLSALVTAAAVGPVLWSGYRVQRRATRRRIQLAAGAVAAAVAVAGLGALAAVVTGAGPAETALGRARAGVAAAKDCDEARATAELEEARRQFGRAEGAFRAWFTKPALAVPLLSQQVEALGRMATAGSELATVAADVAGRADYRSLAVRDGRIDPAGVAALEAPLAEVHTAVVRAGTATAGVDRAWLVAPIRARFDELATEVVTAEAETSVALDAVRVAPGLLGADGPRRYFVAFTTPAESRGLGGFMGNWAELTIEDGRLRLTRSGRAADLIPRGRDPEPVLRAPRDYVARYGPNRPETHPQDLTLSPDFPSVAQAMASVYPQTRGGRPVDGVVALDPYTLAAMLRLTGPIAVPGLAEPLDAANAADYLLRRQYLTFADDHQRVDMLDDATRLAFEAFISLDGLKPAELGAVLGPLVEQRRLLVHSRHAAEQALVERLDMDGALRRTGEGDFLAVVTQNGGNNKIDTFLRRDISYQAVWNPTSGAVEVLATVRLRNEAPASGLPPDVIANREDSAQPPGTNWIWFNLYTHHELIGATIDGRRTDLNRSSELGLNVFHRYLGVPAGGERTVEVRLRGSGSAGASTYALAWYQQPTANPDTVHASVRAAPGWDAAVRSSPAADLGREDGWVVAEARTH